MLFGHPIILPVLARSAWRNQWRQWSALSSFADLITGSIRFPTIPLIPRRREDVERLPPWSSNEQLWSRPEEWNLWGLSLGLTGDLLDLCFMPGHTMESSSLPLSHASSSHSSLQSSIQSFHLAGVELDYIEANWLLRWWRYAQYGRRLGRWTDRMDPRANWDSGVVLALGMSVAWRAAAGALILRRIFRARL